MEKKVFTVAQIRGLLNQVHSDKITFSKFVEILNKQATEKLTISLGELNQALSMSDVSDSCDHPYFFLRGEEYGNPHCTKCGKKLDSE